MRTMLGMATMVGPKGAAAVKNVSQSYPGTLTYTEAVDAVRIDSVVSSDVCVLKLDIEGLEPQVHLQTLRCHQRFTLHRVLV